MEHNPHEQVELCGEVLLKNLRSSRRGAAAGPSGMTGEHLRVILDSESDSDAFTAFARTLAVGEVPHEIMKAIRAGRMTALRKPDGGVRGIVVGDFLRRLVAGTLAQQFSKAVLEATAPFQFALSTKVGTEAVRVASIDEFGCGRNRGVNRWRGRFRSHFPQCHGLRVDGHGARRHIGAIRPSSTSARPRRDCVEGRPGHLSTRHEGAR